MATVVRMPKLLTKERIQEVSNLIVERGLHAHRAAALTGVSIRAHYEWMTKGAADMTPEGLPTSLYAEYAMAVSKAEAALQSGWLVELKEHDGVRWQRFAWLLERRFREEFSLFPKKDKDDATSNTVVVVTDSAQAAI